MNAESAAFVPSSRGRKLSSAAMADSLTASTQPSQHDASSSSLAAASKIPRSASAHNSPLADVASGKFPAGGHAHAPSSTSSNSGGHASSHARSSSLPGNGTSASSRGRGASSTRGRGSSRGRGGARGGSTTASDRPSTHLPKKVASPPSRPPVALDSVDEFPALGGGAPPAPAALTSKTTSSSENDNEKASSPTLTKSSPTLSPSQSMKGLSFARVVAPAPPPSSSASGPTPTSSSVSSSSSSQNTATAQTQEKTTTGPASVSSASISSHSPPTSNPSSISEHTRATSPSTSMSPVMEEQAESAAAAAGASNAKGPAQSTAGKKKKKRSSKDQPQPGQPQGHVQGQGQNTGGPAMPNFDMYNGVYAEGPYERDPFNVILPDNAERPYFEGGPGPVDPSQASLQQQQSPPQPGLTPVQIAFLAANGLSIEGMPNLPNDAGAGMSIEALQEYYNPLIPPPQGAVEQQQQQQASSSSNMNKSTSNKKENAKKSKKERNQAGFPQHQQQQMNGQNGPYGTIDPQQQFPYFDPQYYEEQQQYAQFNLQQQPPFDPTYQQQESAGDLSAQQQQQQDSQQHQPPLNRANGSFHFHPDVPVFQPRHFSPDAQEFKPKSPLLHADAPAFVPPQHHENDPATAEEDVNGHETEEKVPNGFVSAITDSQEETPKPSPEALPEEAEPAAVEAEDEANDQEGQTLPAVSSAVEQVQEKVAETVETVKETISNVVSTESAEEKTEKPAEDVSVEAGPQSPEKEVQSTEEEPLSPPHSTFSLLPPVTVEDVLDKAQSMADSVKETAQDAVTSVEQTVQSVAETVSQTLSTTEDSDSQQAGEHEQVTKDNLDELDIPNEEEASDETTPISAQVEAPTAHDAASNIDELDLPEASDPEALRHAKDSSSTSASDSVAPEMSQYSISPSEVEHQLATATEGESGMPALQAEIEAIAQSSFSAQAQPQFTVVSQSDDQCPTSTAGAAIEQPTLATLEIISTSEDVCDVAFESGDSVGTVSASSSFHIISTSEEQCSTEDETRAVRSSTLDSLASTGSSAAPFVRSSAPSPASRQEELAPPATTTAKPDVPALSIPLDTPPVVISPSTPISPESGSPLRPNQLSSPKPLSKQWQPQRPAPIRKPSEAEKEAAIRLVQELRSEPSTPLLESEEMTVPTSSETANVSTEGESTESDTFRFDLSGRFSELNSSKRKRGKADDEEEDEDPDKKERKVDSGEAPSLTMSIFSGSILPRKQFLVSIFASLGINLFLPFVNGVMLGFGEIFARDWLGPIFGFGRNRSNSNPEQSNNQSFSASGLGIRGAGNKRGGAQDVPGHAAAKTAIETVTEEIVQAPSKL